MQHVSAVQISRNQVDVGYTQNTKGGRTVFTVVRIVTILSQDTE